MSVAQSASTFAAPSATVTPVVSAPLPRLSGSGVPPVPPQPPVESASHPSPCPSWCRDRHQPLAHSFGPSSTWHWSPQYVVDNPRPLPDGPSTLLRAELVRSDEDGVTGGTSLYFQAEGDVDLSADEADIFIAQAQAWVDTLRVLRRQMR